MSKTISMIMISALAFGAFGFAIVQNNKMQATSAINEQLESEKFDLKIDLDEANDKIDDLAIENEDLQAQIVLLKDSIATYASEIKQLKSSLYRRKKEIARMEKDMQQLRNEYFALEAQIQELKNSNVQKDALIQDLEQQKINIQQENDRIYRTNVQMKEDLDASSADIVELEMEKLKQEELLDILEYTQIFFDKISIKKVPSGQDQSKIKKDGKAWNYTYVDVTFQHDNIMHLIDETFVLKIVDIDQNRDISFVESNPAFPESNQDKKGLDFQFTGESMQLVFHNNEIKEGKNYALQLYYFRDGKEHRLKNGYHQFIVNGKLLKRI